MSKPNIATSIMMKNNNFIAALAITLLSFVYTSTQSQEYIVFNQVRYTASKTNSQLDNISNISGSGFKFTSQNSTFALSKTSNNINGTLTYLNSSGTKVSYTGSIEGKFTDNGITIGLYFISGTSYFILVVPGYENHADLQDNDDPNFNSSGPDTQVENLKSTQQAVNNVVATMSDGNATESATTTYVTFTLTFTQNRSTNNTITFTPTLTSGTATSGTDFSSSMSYSTDNVNWTNITTNASVAYNKNTVYIRCQVTDDTRPECAETFSLSTGTLTHSGTTEVDNYSGVYSMGTINDNNDPLVWTGTTSTSWDLATNWTPNLSPNSCYYIEIPASLSNYPVFTSSSTNTSVAGITIASGGKLNVSSGTLTASGPIINNDNTDGVYGDGTLELNGTSAQTISGTGVFNNLKINNTAGVSISSGTTSITGVLTPTAGTITTNDRLTIKQSSTVHGVIGPITGCPRPVFTGNVTLERYIPASNRAYRFLTPGVTSTTTIKQNWQENSNVTDPNGYPNAIGPGNLSPGYGTHITGSTTGQNGFDATLTGNPSLFTFNRSNQTWESVTNTDVNTFNAGQAFRILVRGSRVTDLRTNTPTPDNTTLRVTGTLTTCEYIFDANSTIPLSGTSGNYSFIGNPFWSVVDWSTLSITGVEDNIYYWDPTINGNNNRGAYVTYNRSTNTNSNNASSLDKYLQPGQAFFVKTTSSSPSITFAEIRKTNGNRRNIFEVNRNTEVPIEGAEASQKDLPLKKYENISVALKTMGPSNANTDASLLMFGEDFGNSYGKEDASKLNNLDENIALVNNGVKHAILGKQTISNFKQDTTPISLWNLYERSYTIEIDPRQVESNKNIYFVNNKNKTTTLLDNSKIFSYAFVPMANEKTINDFSIVVSKKDLPVDQNTRKNNFFIYPNPASNEIHISLPNKEVAKSIKIYDVNGRTLLNKAVKTEQSSLNISSLPKGNYWIEVGTANQIFKSKLSKLK